MTANVLLHDFNSDVGRKSSGDDLADMVASSRSTSSSDTGANVSMNGPTCGRSDANGSEHRPSSADEMADLMRFTFSMKNDAIDVQNTVSSFVAPLLSYLLCHRGV